MSRCKHCRQDADGRSFCKPDCYLQHDKPPLRARSFDNPMAVIGGGLQYDDQKWLKMAQEGHDGPKKNRRS